MPLVLTEIGILLCVVRVPAVLHKNICILQKIVNSVFHEVSCSIQIVRVEMNLWMGVHMGRKIFSNQDEPDIWFGFVFRILNLKQYPFNSKS